MARDPELAEVRERAPRDQRPADSRGFSVQHVRTRSAGAFVPVATGLVVLLVGLAIAKPWDEGTGGQPSRSPRVPAAATAGPPAPTADVAATLAGPVCLGAEAWRVTSHETWRSQEVRVWRSLEPIADASGPLDPAIPSVPIVAVELDALGWCAAAWGPERPVGPADVNAWLVTGRVARELGLVRVEPEADTPIAALYVPGDLCAGRAPCPSVGSRPWPGGWPGGRVVFRYEDLGAGTVAWFAADVVLLDHPTAPGPAAS
jgi:hypothetical protein